MSWNDTDPCTTCGAKAPCYLHCSGAEDGKHAYKPGSIEVRAGRTGDDHVLVDVTCKNCGQSGSCLLELNEGNVSWG